MSDSENARIHARIKPSQATGAWSSVIGLAAFATLIAWAITRRSDFVTFLDAQCLAIAVLGPVALLVASYGWVSAKSAFGLLFAVSKPNHGLQSAVDFFRAGAAFALVCGFLGALIGFVIMLQNLDDPSRLGPAMATVLFTQLYGMLLATLSVVFSIRLSRRHTGAEAAIESSSLGQEALLVGGPAIAVGMLSVVACFLVVAMSVFGMPS